MAEYEAHSFAPSVDPRDSLAEGADKIVHCYKQHVRQDCSLQMSPQSLDQVETWAVRGQPVDLDPVAVLLQPGLYGFGRVEPSIVADQADLLARVNRHQGNQECQEVRPVLTGCDRIGDPAGGVIDTAVDNPL